MRIALISDSHSSKNIDYIYEYLNKKAFSWKLDLILINGDILGEDEVREGYGFNFKKKVYDLSIDKKNILMSVTPDYEYLMKITQVFDRGIKDEKVDIEMSQHINSYVKHRYQNLYIILDKFSKIRKTFFNIGTYESPLHFNVLKELAWLLDVPESYIRSIAMLSNYRDNFKDFLGKIKDPKNNNLKYIGGTSQIIGDIMFAGIPGLNSSSGLHDSVSEFQEKITSDLISTVRRQLSYINKLVILNQTQGKLRRDPFSFRPGSLSVREFIESIKGKLRQKIFIQSYHHFMTTHFYEAMEFNFILNNSAVNNCLFNLLEISNKVSCYDVDPKNDKVTKLNLYNYNLSDYETPSERLSLNYENSEEIIKQRNIEKCYYM
jgi:Icc-related predicted phosphoesterase